MKKLRLTLFLALAAFIIMPAKGSAQGRFGKDSVECVNYLNFYADFLKQGNMKDAYENWVGAMKYCPPKVSQNLYINGRKIMHDRISNFKGDAATRDAMIDTLVMLADRRAEYFPNRGKAAIEGKLSDLMIYYGEDASKAKLMYQNLDAYATKFGKDADPQLVVNAMIKASELFKAQQITEEEVMNAYSKYNDIFEAKRIANPAEFAKIDEEEAMLQNAFINSGVATCDNLIKVFTPRFQQSPNDTTLLKMISGLLNINECTDTELFSDVVANMYKLKPTAGSAYYLYRFFMNKGDESSALDYLKEATNVATGIDKGTYLYELATVHYKNRNYSSAVSVARQASELNPKYAGKAEMLIGTIWASVSCGGDEIAKRAKFWVATDYMQRAKAKDPSLAAEADKNIIRYRAYFPKAEDAFMYDLVDGRSYTVSCGGMSASTIVRTNK